MTGNRNVLIDTILKLHVGAILVFIFAPILGSFVFSLNSDRFPSLPLGHFSTEWYRLIWEDPFVWTGFFNTVVVGLIVAGLPALIATDWVALPAIVWVTILYTALFATAASFALTQFASLRIPAANVMAYTYLVPVWVIVWELALGAGGPPPLILPGIAFIVLALVAMLGEDGRIRPGGPLQ